MSAKKKIQEIFLEELKTRDGAIRFILEREWCNLIKNLHT